MEHGYKTTVYRRLKRAGLHAPADALREALICIFKAENETAEKSKPNKQLVEEAWREMGEVFTSPLEKIETLKEKLNQAKEKLNQVKETPTLKDPTPTFQGYAGELDDLVDPDYQETDAGKRIRDSWLWAGFAFRRITRDYADGSTVMDFSKAKTPPPTDMAVGIAESYGVRPPDDRRGLYDKMALFAVKSHTPKDDSEEVDTSEADAVLAALEEDESCNGPAPTTS